ncbi:MAG: type II secretion system protein N [Candidatus Thiodiazotropha sp.]
MNSWRHSLNAMTLLLLLAIGAMCANLYFQWRSPSWASAPMTQEISDDNKSKNTTSGGVAKFVPISIRAYDEITQRPLFVEGRLPPAEPEPEKAVTRKPHKPLRLKLEGVAMMPENRVAIIRDLDTNELYRVAQGMNKNDWKVESVDSESATIVRKRERVELKLEIDEASANKINKPKRKLPFKPSKR